MHDELGQYLTVLKMSVARLELNKANDYERPSGIDEILKQIDNCLNIVRKISYELRPAILDDLGIIEALDWYAMEFEKRTGIKTEFKARSVELKLPEVQAIGLFRIFQESLTNVARHSNSKTVSSSLHVKKKSVELTIKDKGKGFEKSALASSKKLGLLGMKERTLLMNGNCEILSTLGKGTVVKITIPIS